MPQVEEHFLAVLREHTAGDPMRQEVKWTNLTRRDICRRLAERGITVGRRVIKQLLKEHGYVKRKAQKTLAMGPRHRDRNAQFENIARLRQQYRQAGEPVISMDTKKKEMLGNFYRDGRLYTQEVQKVFDHDFPSSASGVVHPHGLYDVTLNRGHINLGISHDTSEFACASLEHWWNTQGRQAYPNATRLLLLCDGGGSNNARHYVFKQDIQAAAQRMGVEIRIAHYPPYCSKYNPIEHRLFPHVTRACQGVVFQTTEIVKKLIEKTSTTTGLQVTVDILHKFYHTGRECTDDFKRNMKIRFDEFLPQWNYRTAPVPT